MPTKCIVCGKDRDPGFVDRMGICALCKILADEDPIFKQMVRDLLKLNRRGGDYYPKTMMDDYVEHRA